MTYIKTKDGRIMESEINDNRKSLGYEPIPFIKQADTIEELCDEYVIINWTEEDGWGEPQLVKNKVSIYQLQKLIKFDSKSHKVYGAIWTDKGLIYVAKMNEKGELELL